MNCQAFRKAWLEDTDSDVISHIETCEECIAWIENQMTTDEEVQFLKEVPLPSVNLEERIMQAIYQDAGKGTPPHAATESLQPPTPIASKRRTKGFPSLAWVSAAAVLLVVGLAGYQQLQSDGQQMAAQPQSANGGASQGIAYNAENQPQMAKADTPAQSPDMSSTTAAPATAGTENQQPLAETAPAGSAMAPKTAETPSVMANSTLALANPEAKTVSPQSRATHPESPTARSAKTNQPASESASKETALADNSIASKSPSQAAENTDQSAAASNEPVFSLTAQTLPEADQNASAKSMVGPPLPTVQKAAITLSTFSDLETAVQASDLPVPVLAPATSGFAVSDISVQYESETSQKATRLTADYKRNKSWIKIDVVRNTHGKRSLSIPGTFTATQLFTIGGEQAIGVSFDQQGAKSSTVQHAVHFNAQAENQSLYVVISANGISLDELIETSKQLTWE
ncbi:hypothetical protein AN963_20530 [Brevibacillus choshinensis]|uniref:Anti-sigma factor n=1 Tax=Brevibacillus choshinensis TaxID=54911 RepID=A0ABR5N033_BRECH|nr:anti-sigma factor [Brevibacillus choshinensis]KQL43860.1 hypothetical protein AN963_20530 [Brevibacillus choshinensis]